MVNGVIAFCCLKIAMCQQCTWTHLIWRPTRPWVHRWEQVHLLLTQRRHWAARISTKTRKFDHITPVLVSLHWLPVHVRSHLKVLLVTYKIINGFAPSYLSDLIKPYVLSHALCSQNTGLPELKSQLAAGPFPIVSHPDVDRDHCPPGDSASPPLSLVCMLSCLYLSECCACLLCVCMACPLPGLHGGEVVWIRSYLSRQSLKLLDVLRIHPLYFCSTIYISVIKLYTLQFCCWCILYTRHLLHGCPSWERDPSSVALPDGFFHVFPVKGFCGEFFLIWIEGLRTEGVVCCTDCKAPWGKVWFVILGYRNKTDLTWFDWAWKWQLRRTETSNDSCVALCAHLCRV